MGSTNDSYRSFEQELRISHRPMIGVLAFLGLALVFAALAQSQPLARWRMLALALLSYSASATASLLSNRRPWIGQWTTLIALAAIILLTSGFLGLYELLILLFVPTGLAVAMIGIPAAVSISLGETMFVLLLPKLTPVEARQTATVITVMVIWGTLLMMVAVYRRVHQLDDWMTEYYQRAQGVLEEARNRRAEFEQSLQDLANANRQIALSNERLASLRLIAEDAQKAKAAFVAKVSHEFRTPLNMIIGLVSLTVETPSVYAEDLPLELQEDLNTVYRNCEHLASLINDVLDLSQAEAGRFTLYKERVNMKEIINSALVVTRPLVEKKGLELEVSIPDHLPEVYCDRTRIRQVVLNLASNAARFTDEGGLEIRVARRGEYVQFSVADTGPGIPPEDIKRIFEPFCQGSGRLWRDRPGSGLGLTISKQFVQRHGGRIWVESKVGVGTTFFVELPISAPVEHLVGADRWMKAHWAWMESGFRTGRVGLADQTFRPRIILCDETDTLYPAFARSCDAVEFIGTGDVGQAAHEARQFPVSAVVLNSTAPEELWSLMRKARQEMPGTPLIGCCVPPRLQRAVEAGATTYLVKPVMQHDLEKAIRTLRKPVKRVLVVDDDPEVLRLFKRMLRVLDNAMEVTLAISGERALEEMREQLPDLVLLDVVMPGMDGWEVLKRKGEEDHLRDIPVIFISGQDPTEQPLASEVVMVTMDEGLALNQLLTCSLELPALLTKPVQAPDPTPAQTAGVEQAWRRRAQHPEPTRAPPP
jgi:signal transduction histidine kinase/CheY-like chemotaxis protein